MFRPTHALKSSRLANAVSEGSFVFVVQEVLLRELRCVNLKALARMGNQHLSGHSETLPTDTDEGTQLAPLAEWRTGFKDILADAGSRMGRTRMRGSSNDGMAESPA